ncbi:MAG: hypothetical protein RIS68_786, partial [Bacteroidota bacterium]
MACTKRNAKKFRQKTKKDEIQSIKPLVSSQIRLFLRLGLSLFSVPLAITTCPI